MAATRCELRQDRSATTAIPHSQITIRDIGHRVDHVQMCVGSGMFVARFSRAMDALNGSIATSIPDRIGGGTFAGNVIDVPMLANNENGTRNFNDAVRNSQNLVSAR